MPAPALPIQPAAPAAIGVFDSGVGGLSVLRALQAQMPHTPLLYFADSGHAPYGERDDAHVQTRSLHIASALLARGARQIVVACNTATAVAVRQLRERWPDLPIVGVEPGVKPGVAASRNGRVGVMATRVTLHSERFQRLLADHGPGTSVIAQPCPGLAALIEQGDLQSPALRDRVRELVQPLVDAQVDTVVLGCTHYVFARHWIEAALGPQVQIIDTTDAVVRQTQRQFEAMHLPIAAAVPQPLLLTSGEPATLERIAGAWLPFECNVQGTD
jgi:glutamate racemase